MPPESSPSPSPAPSAVSASTYRVASLEKVASDLIALEPVLLKFTAAVASGSYLTLAEIAFSEVKPIENLIADAKGIFVAPA